MDAVSTTTQETFLSSSISFFILSRSKLRNHKTTFHSNETTRIPYQERRTHVPEAGYISQNAGYFSIKNRCKITIN